MIDPCGIAGMVSLETARARGDPRALVLFYIDGMWSAIPLSSRTSPHNHRRAAPRTSLRCISIRDTSFIGWEVLPILGRKWFRSSAGQNASFLNLMSQVRVLPGPPRGLQPRIVQSRMRQETRRNSGFLRLPPFPTVSPSIIRLSKSATRFATLRIFATPICGKSI